MSCPAVFRSIVRRLVIAVLLAGVAAGCSNRTRINSSPVSGYGGDPKRLLVVANIANSASNLRAAGVQEQIAASLERCGTTVSAITIPARETAPSPAGAQARDAAIVERLRSFQAEAILTLTQVDQTMRVRTDGRDAVASHATYTAWLEDVASGTRIWRGTISLPVTSRWQGGKPLAEALVERLAADGILRGCSAKRAAGPAGAGGRSGPPGDWTGSGPDAIVRARMNASNSRQIATRVGLQV